MPRRRKGASSKDRRQEEQKGGESSPPTRRETERWSEVVGRKATKEAKRREIKESQIVGSSVWTGARKTSVTGKVQAGEDETPRKNTSAAMRRNVYTRPPRSAAVCITAARKGGTAIRDVMTKIRKEIDLSSIGVEIWDTRKTMTGGTLLEIKGPERKEQAKTLANKIEVVVSGTGARVSVPRRTAEIRLNRIEESVTREEVIAAVAMTGGCDTADVSASALKQTKYGLCWTIVKCPLDIVPKLVKNCEAEGSRCAVCADSGRPADQRLGSERCQPQESRGNGKERYSERKGDEVTGKGRESGVIAESEVKVRKEIFSTTKK